MEINYDELVQSYWDGLFHKLRSFTAGPQFLETWVHDEDHTRSLFALFEAASSANQPSLAVIVGPKTLGELKLHEVEAELASLGEVRSTERNGSRIIEVKFRQGG